MDIETQLRDGQVQLRFPQMTLDEFITFCQHNTDLNLERNAEGDVIAMPPADAWGDSRNAEFVADLILWNRARSEPGIVFGPSAGFTLPNGAVRSPDAAWISRKRWDSLSTDAKAAFAQICPEFVVEILSPTDSLVKTQQKMKEYLANGAELGWLFDRKNRTVYIYRPEKDVVTLTEVTEIAGDPEMPGLLIRLDQIF
jgi:Uma2 family endonuclease